MTSRIVFPVLVASLLCFTSGPPGLYFVATPAYAGNYSAGEETGPGTKTRKKIPKPVLKNAPAKPVKQVAVHKNYSQSKYREIRDFQTKLAGYAGKDSLKGLATDPKRLRKFANAHDKMEKKYPGNKSLEFTKIFQQLGKYANQKQDLELRKFAKGILKSFDVFAAEKRARAKLEKFVKAEGYGRKVSVSLEYADAKADYNQAVRALPKEMRAGFPPLAKIKLK